MTGNAHHVTSAGPEVGSSPAGTGAAAAMFVVQQSQSFRDVLSSEPLTPEMGQALLSHTRVTPEIVRQAAKQNCGGKKHGTAYAIVIKPRDALVTASHEIVKEFQGAMDDELYSMLSKHETLAIASLDDITPEDELLPSLIILSRKGDGRAKARLVACGNHQHFPSDDTFASVVSHESWLLLAILCIIFGGDLLQLDISTAFLQSDPSKFARRTYLRPPSAFKHYDPLNLIVITSFLC